MRWEDVRGRVQELALEREEYAGYPVPLDHLTLRVSPRVFYRHGEQLDGATLDPPGGFRCSTEDVDETFRERNRWWSERHGSYVVVYEQGGRIRHGFLPGAVRGELLIGTLAATDAWSLDAELRATERLAELVSERAFKMYLMTGGFMETSRRSGVTYLFRRLRPTIALGSDEHGKARILAALCMHPIAYYEGSWAGAMVPTDDLLSHLIMMRGDEPKLWRMANQHPAWTVASGL